MTGKTTITPEDSADLQQLQSDLELAHREGAAALLTQNMQRLQAIEAKQAAIVRRIKEIQGTAGKHWMA